MDVGHRDGRGKAYLHDTRYSAFPDSEQEYLLGWTDWRVTKISQETLVYKDEDNGIDEEFKAMVIYLYDGI